MARDQKYGQVSIPGVRDDEPVFIVRGQDALAIAAIGAYEDLASKADSSAEFMAGLDSVQRTFSEWRDENLTKMKFPD